LHIMAWAGLKKSVHQICRLNHEKGREDAELQFFRMV